MMNSKKNVTANRARRYVDGSLCLLFLFPVVYFKYFYEELLLLVQLESAVVQKILHLVTLSTNDEHFIFISIDAELIFISSFLLSSYFNIDRDCK